ncbi:Deleted in azoospermia-like, partial [Frankliniella fusca]
LQVEADEARGIKWNMAVSVGASREIEKSGEIQWERESKTLVSQPQRLLAENDGETSQQVETAILEVMNGAENLRLAGSSWVVSDVFYAELHVAVYRPLRGGSFVPTPAWLGRKKVVVNVATRRNHECFRLSILAHLYPVADRGLESDPRSYTEHYHSLNFGRLDSANMKVKDIDKFLELNPGFSLSVLAAEKKNIYPLYCPKEKKAEHVVLLLLSRRGKRHYTLVRDMNRLLYSQTRHRARKYFCVYCLCPFPSSQNLSSHETDCAPFGAQKTIYPRDDEYLSFDSSYIRKMGPVDHMIFYDVETYTRANESVVPSKKTVVEGYHEVYAYCLLIVDGQGVPVKEPVVYSGENTEEVMSHFLDTLFREEEYLFHHRVSYPRMPSAEQAEQCESATVCHICRRPFREGEVRVVDHDHARAHSNVLGVAHATCNIHRQRPAFIPVLAHANFKFDIHPLILAASRHEKFRACDVKIIPKTFDHYRGLTLVVDKKNRRELRFLDSYQHVSSPLDQLAASLGPRDLYLLDAFIPDPLQNALMRRKGVFCYDYVKSLQQMRGVTSLPEREHFYNKLKREPVKDEDYEHARKVWAAFRCANLEQYACVYLLADVLILASFFLKYRASSMEKFGYEVCHFWSSPALSLACALRYSQSRIKLLSDPTMHLFFEKSIRGGTSYAGLRHARANHPDLPDYDPSEKMSHLLMTDVNALYSYALQQPLPVDDFRWLSGEEECRAFLASPSYQDGVESACFECDLSYHIRPNETSIHECWPLAPVHCKVKKAWLSPYQRRLAEAAGLSESQFTRKLLAFIGPRQHYILHASLLELYCELGMRVTRFHRAVAFRQEPVFKTYIDHLIQERQKAQLPFLSTYFKGLCNQLYGSLNKRVRDYRNIALCTSEKKFEKLVASPAYKAFRIFGADLTAVESIQKQVRLNQPLFAASAVLDISKAHMTRMFWRLKSHFISQPGKTCTLFQSDTDSAGVYIQSDDLDADLRSLGDMFDFSGLPRWHPLYDESRARVPGLLKIEYGSFLIREIVSLRSKMYAMIMQKRVPPGQAQASGEVETQTVRKCKGVPSAVLYDTVSMGDYKRCVFQSFSKEVQCLTIRTDGLHQLLTLRQRKQCLSAFDDKRKILEDGIRTIPYCLDSEGNEVEWPQEMVQHSDDDDEQLGELVRLIEQLERGGEMDGASQ